ncbi:NAD(P)-binding protein [Leucogyrophana mollusca]|uniref:NAD(P)-binding protein n=1 Tax=Leucogyrophana mollusca TaxID=85980 RepID=A0ACB8B4Y0_9AGAM|nr:NAD(P)-binding protein [Leucogyrophana mollusca]
MTSRTVHSTQGGVVPSTEEGIVAAVCQVYSAKAKDGADPTYADTVARAFGYTPEQLQSIPVESHLGLSCGNPVAAASIKQGETVLDLGSGGGIDIFLAAANVGPTGQAIGLDISADMIALARRNAARKGLKPPHVAFVQAPLTEPLPIASGTVDCVLSNCVINLLPTTGKAALLKEVWRVLRPGGRVVLDDIVARKELPESLRLDLASYIGCISGALQLDEYKALITDAGFSDALFVDTQGDLNIYTQNGAAGCCAPNITSSSSGCCPPALTATTTSGCCPPAPAAKATSGCCAPKSTTPAPSNTAAAIGNVNEWAASYQIYAMKALTGGENDAPSTPASSAPSALLSWVDAYPSPKAPRTDISCEDVAALLHEGGGNYAVIDVRRNDHAGGHVRGSLQCPAQTFYDDLPSFYEKFCSVERVVFYCNSSGGRGPRCAAWYQDYLDEHGNTGSKALVMTGGIKAWLEKYGEVKDLTDRD